MGRGPAQTTAGGFKRGPRGHWVDAQDSVRIAAATARLVDWLESTGLPSDREEAASMVAVPITSSDPVFHLADDDTSLRWAHQCPARPGATSMDVILIDSPHWQLLEIEPLSLREPLFCTHCGLHGWIRAGRWIEISRPQATHGHAALS